MFLEHTRAMSVQSALANVVNVCHICLLGSVSCIWPILYMNKSVGRTFLEGRTDEYDEHLQDSLHMAGHP